MENVRVLAVELVKLCIPMLIGFVCVKTKYLPGELADSVSKLIARVIFPVMMFCIFVNPGLPLTDIVNSRWLLLTAIVWVVVCFVTGLGAAKLMRLDEKQAPVFMVLSGMSNVTYMGIPICVALFGDQFGRLGVALCSLAGHIAMWTVGVLLMGFMGKGEKKFSFKSMVSPVTIAIALAIVIKLTGLALPDVIYAPLSALGDTTPWVALVYIGMLIGRADFRSVLRSRSLPVFLLLKLLLLPLLFGLLMHLFGGYLDEPSRGLLMVEYSTSAMISLTPYFRERGLDADYAAKLVFSSVLLNIFTLPLVMLINSLY